MHFMIIIFYGADELQLVCFKCVMFTNKKNTLRKFVFDLLMHSHLYHLIKEVFNLVFLIVAIFTMRKAFS